MYCFALCFTCIVSVVEKNRLEKEDGNFLEHRSRKVEGGGNKLVTQWIETVGAARTRSHFQNMLSLLVSELCSVFGFFQTMRGEHKPNHLCFESKKTTTGHRNNAKRSHCAAGTARRRAGAKRAYCAAGNARRRAGAKHVHCAAGTARGKPKKSSCERLRRKGRKEGQ